MKYLVFSLFIVFFSTCGYSEERMALLIANSNYKADKSKLENPKFDIKTMYDVLSGKGFNKIFPYENLDVGEFKAVISNFVNELHFSYVKHGEQPVALFYYAGHGFSYNGVNYLSPIGSIEKMRPFSRENIGKINRSNINMNAVIKILEKSASDTNIYFLDSCRNNPFAASNRKINNKLLKTQRGYKKRDITGKPANSFPEIFKDTYELFAAPAGNTTPDGIPGMGSYFTNALAESIDIPKKLSFKDIARKVREILEHQGISSPVMGGGIPQKREFYFSNCNYNFGLSILNDLRKLHGHDVIQRDRKIKNILLRKYNNYSGYIDTNEELSKVDCSVFKAIDELVSPYDTPTNYGLYRYGKEGILRYKANLIGFSENIRDELLNKYQQCMSCY